MSIEFYTWSDGGGEYAAVIQQRPDGAQVTLINDDALRCQATVIRSAWDAQKFWIEYTYRLTEGYAAVFYRDVRDETGPIVGVQDDAYLILAKGVLYAVIL